ncbi:hypothetical protein ABZ912_58365 [Nonomuraea angiospora]|uniref:hypothetical protein n=1 Tax=Nonomuraea angiospora TaxID=46172 RepID=UPI0033C622D4
MWIAVVVLAAIVVGAMVWWFRRDAAGRAAGDAGTTVEADMDLGIPAEVEPAFMEGLRAYPLRVSGRRGVLTTYEPPRLISLHLLADAFAARGDAALHDPQGTVVALIAHLGAVERPGVLHLREDWLDGEVDGMDRAAFAEAVREAVAGECPWSADHAIGALQVTVREANTMMLDLARVLELYREAREKQPEAAAGELLREVAPRLIAAGGPGLTWTKPPTQADLRVVLGGTPEPA